MRLSTFFSGVLALASVACAAVPPVPRAHSPTVTALAHHIIPTPDPPIEGLSPPPPHPPRQLSQLARDTTQPNPITYPTTSTVWTVGQAVTITLDPAVVKNEDGMMAELDLNGENSVQVLDSNFVSNTGFVEITVPDVPSGTYTITCT